MSELPARPSLAHLRKQAKELLSRLRATARWSVRVCQLAEAEVPRRKRGVGASRVPPVHVKGEGIAFLRQVRSEPRRQPVDRARASAAGADESQRGPSQRAVRPSGPLTRRSAPRDRGAIAGAASNIRSDSPWRTNEARGAGWRHRGRPAPPHGNRPGASPARCARGETLPRHRLPREARAAGTRDSRGHRHVT